MFPDELQGLDHFKNFLPLFGVWAHREQLILDLPEVDTGLLWDHPEISEKLRRLAKHQSQPSGRPVRHPFESSVRSAW